MLLNATEVVKWGSRANGDGTAPTPPLRHAPSLTAPSPPVLATAPGTTGAAGCWHVHAQVRLAYRPRQPYNCAPRSPVVPRRRRRQSHPERVAARPARHVRQPAVGGELRQHHLPLPHVELGHLLGLRGGSKGGKRHVCHRRGTAQSPARGTAATRPQAPVRKRAQSPVRKRAARGGRRGAPAAAPPPPPPPPPAWRRRGTPPSTALAGR
jgi:hypothetical protein